MAKFEVLKDYMDKELGILEAGQEVEMTVARSEEVAKNAKEKGLEGDYLKRLDEPKQDKKEDKKEG